MPQPPALAAHRTLSWAIRARLARSWSCFDCGVPVPASQPHFDDPGRPLAVRWYCARCWRVDKRERAAASQAEIEGRTRAAQAASHAAMVAQATAHLHRDPVLRTRLAERVRARLPRAIRDLDEGTPLFRQLLAREHQADPSAHPGVSASI